MASGEEAKSPVVGACDALAFVTPCLQEDASSFQQLTRVPVWWAPELRRTGAVND